MVRYGTVRCGVDFGLGCSYGAVWCGGKSNGGVRCGAARRLKHRSTAAPHRTASHRDKTLVFKGTNSIGRFFFIIILRQVQRCGAVRCAVLFLIPWYKYPDRLTF